MKRLRLINEIKSKQRLIHGGCHREQCYPQHFSICICWTFPDQRKVLVVLVVPIFVDYCLVLTIIFCNIFFAIV